MSGTREKALLPVGLSDLLPPDASHEAAAIEALMGYFAAHGYGRIKPPLLEFEETLLSGSGAAMANATFRLMDPVSKRMMGLRADITLQAARIATTRLATMPRPLRLSYAGEVLRVAGTQMHPAREFTQVGVELIGAARMPAQVAADVEMVTLAAGALLELGIDGLSVDLTMPTLVPALLGAADLTLSVANQLKAALDHKDVPGVAEALGGAGQTLARQLTALLEAAGPMPEALDKIAAIDLPPAAAAERDRLTEVARQTAATAPELLVTIDPAERQGFEYHSGVSFAFFAPQSRGELGRGGRYIVEGTEATSATGFTLFMDAVCRLLPKPETPRRLYLPGGVGPARAAALRKEGWVTLRGLDEAEDPIAEARRLECSHLLTDKGPIPVQ